MSASLPELLIKITFWLGAAWAGHFALGKFHPRWRVLLWRMTIVALVALPLLLLWMPRLPVLPSMPTLAPHEEAAETAFPHRTEALSPSSPVSSGAPQIIAGKTPSERRSTSPAPEVAAPNNFNFLAAALGFYFLPVFVLLAALVTAWARMLRLIKRSSPASPDMEEIAAKVARDFSISRSVALGISAEISSPLLTGWLRPRMLLPANLPNSLDRRQLQVIVAHELAHLAARDVAWSLGIRVVQILLWFHPLAWRIGAAHGRACEEVADGVSAGYVKDVTYYGDTLTALALRTHAWHVEAVSLPIASTSSLPRRLRNLQKNTLGRRLRNRAIISGAVFTFCFLALWAALSVSHRVPSLYGTVVDPAGHAIPHAAVIIAYGSPKTGAGVLCPSSYPDCLKQTMTDQNGRFRIDLVAGDLKFILLTAAPGFRGTWQFDAMKGNEPLRLTLKPQVGPIPAGVVATRGQVLDSQGRAIPYATIRPDGRKNEEAMAVADANGRFELRLQPEAKPRVFVQAPGFAPKLVTYSSATELSVTLERGADLHGRLIRGGSGIAGAEIILQDKNEDDTPLNEVRMVETGPNGDFVFPHIPTGRLYLINARRASLPRGTAAHSLLAQPRPNATDVAIGDIEVQSALAVPGQLHLPAGKSFPPGSQLLVMPEGFLDFKLIDLQGDGTFEANAFPGERIEIAAVVPGYTLQTDKHGDAPRYFEVRDAKSRIDATLVPQADAEMINGVVLDPQGKPVSDISVGVVLDGETADIIELGLFKSAYSRPNVRTNKAGEFRLPRPATGGTIVATGAAGFGELNLTQASQPLRLQSWGRVAGRYAPGGVAVGRRSVSADFTRKAPGKPMIRYCPRTICDENGQFVLDGVPAGEVAVSVRFDTDPVGFGTALYTYVKVTWGQTTAVDFAARGCTLTGRVDIPSGTADLLDFDKNESSVRREIASSFRPPPGAMGEAYQKAREAFEQTPQWREEQLQHLQFGVRFGADGQFEVRGLPPGRYTFSAQVLWKSKGAILDSGAWANKGFEIKPDQTTLNLGNIPARVGEPPLAVGNPAPKFEFSSFEGNSVSSEKLNGHVLAIQLTRGDNPWGKSWEEDARDFFGGVQRNVNGSDKVKYLLFTAADSESVFQDRCRAASGFWQNCYFGKEGESALKKAFGVTGNPVEIIIGADGRLAYLGYNFGEATVVAAEEVGKALSQ